MKNVSKIVLLFCMFGLVFSSCKEKEDDKPGGDKPTITGLAVTPASSVSYGDVLTLTGKFEDKTSLKTYDIVISNPQGEFFSETKMLTGKTFDLNAKLVIPLPKNAQAGNVTISVTLKNGEDATVTEDLTLANVAVPAIENLYLAIGQKKYTMEKSEDDFVVIDFFDANAKGKIHLNFNLDGMFWGGSGTTLNSLDNDDITINDTGNAVSLKVSFNPKTFAFSVEPGEEWVDIPEVYYIQGTISNHWHDWGPDGMTIEADILKLKGQAIKNGVKKRWTWSARDDANGDEVDWGNHEGSLDTWWGNCKAGAFSLKKGGTTEYILWNGSSTVKGNSDVINQRFPLETGGWGYYIILEFDGTDFKVTIDHNGPTVEFSVAGLSVNGLTVPATMNFGGSNLAKLDGSNYKFEGIVNLTKGQTNITATGVNLAFAKADDDVFLGQGQASWEMKGSTGEWLIRLDPLLSSVYACKMTGYPDVIYMDAWGWSRFDGQPANNWAKTSRLCLQRTNETSLIYEATFFHHSWGDFDDWGPDFNIFASNPYEDDVKIPNMLFSGGVQQEGEKMLMAATSGGRENPAYMRIRVDLKDGFDLESLEPVGDNFTITFTELN